MQRFGVTARRFRQRLALSRQLSDRLLRPPRHQLGEEGEADDHQRAAKRGHADPEVKQEADENIERHPRQIEQRDRAGARQEGAHLVDVAQRLQAVTAAAREQRKPADHAIDALAQAFAERASDPDQDTAAQQVEQALEGVENDHHDGEADQRRDAAAREHAVVDLQHVDRAGEIEHVDERARERDARNGAATGA